MIKDLKSNSFMMASQASTSLTGISASQATTIALRCTNCGSSSFRTVGSGELFCIDCGAQCENEVNEENAQFEDTGMGHGSKMHVRKIKVAVAPTAKVAAGELLSAFQKILIMNIKAMASAVGMPSKPFETVARNFWFAFLHSWSQRSRYPIIECFKYKYDEEFEKTKMEKKDESCSSSNSKNELKKKDASMAQNDATDFAAEFLKNFNDSDTDTESKAGKYKSSKTSDDNNTNDSKSDSTSSSEDSNNISKDINEFNHDVMGVKMAPPRMYYKTDRKIYKYRKLGLARRDNNKNWVLTASEIVKIRIELILGMLYLLTRWFKLGIIPIDLVHWAANGVLIYYNAFMHLPAFVRERLKQYRKFFLPYQLISPKQVAFFAERFALSINIEMPQLNMQFAGVRMVKGLNLPESILDTYLDMIKSTESANLRSPTFRNGFKITKRANAFPEFLAKFLMYGSASHAMALLVVACKMCSGWEDWVYERHCTKSVEEKNSNQEAYMPPQEQNTFSLLVRGDLNEYVQFAETKSNADPDFRNGWSEIADQTGQYLQEMANEIEGNALQNNIEGNTLQCDSDYSSDESHSSSDSGVTRGTKRKQHIYYGLQNPCEKAKEYRQNISRAQDDMYLAHIVVSKNHIFHPHYTLLIEMCARYVGISPWAMHRLVMLIDEALDAEVAKSLC